MLRVRPPVWPACLLPVPVAMFYPRVSSRNTTRSLRGPGLLCLPLVSWSPSLDLQASAPVLRMPAGSELCLPDLTSLLPKRIHSYIRSFI